MIRRIIEIDEEKCNGCGICAQACHEGAIGVVEGKAKLLRDDYCDGLGDCLPACPTGAISFVEREAAAYDAAAVQARMKKHSGCESQCSAQQYAKEKNVAVERTLRNFPVQIKLVPVIAPYYDNCKLLIAADCTAYAYPKFHEDFIRGKITLVGCPKLDNIDYSEKLAQIIQNNNIKSITLVRMTVPCCGGLEFALKKALEKSGKVIPWQVVTIDPEGNIID